MFKKLLLLLTLLPAQAFGHIVSVTILRHPATGKTIVFLGDRHTPHPDVPKQDAFLKIVYDAINRPANADKVLFLTEAPIDRTPYTAQDIVKKYAPDQSQLKKFQDEPEKLQKSLEKIGPEDFLWMCGLEPSFFEYYQAQAVFKIKETHKIRFDPHNTGNKLDECGETLTRLAYKDEERNFITIVPDERNTSDFLRLQARPPTSQAEQSAILSDLHTTLQTATDQLHLAPKIKATIRTYIEQKFKDTLHLIHLLFRVPNSFIDKYAYFSGLLPDSKMIEIIENSDQPLIFIHYGKSHGTHLADMLCTPDLGWNIKEKIESSTQDITHPKEWAVRITQAINHYLDQPIKLQICANESCNMVKKPHQLKRCAQCHTTYYCNADCQRADWIAGHKKVCQPVQVAEPAPAQAAEPARVQVDEPARAQAAEPARVQVTEPDDRTLKKKQNDPS